MAGLLLKHVCKTYPNGLQAVRDFNLEVRDREYLVLMGPSGCGKSTLLRMIAGLEEITSGKIYMNDQDVSGTDPRDRNLAMVFKNSTLYPEMTVYENMAFALRLGRFSQNEISGRIEETAKVLGIEGVLEKEPDGLSRVDRCRVLLARAVVRKPELLLLDGIFSGLDKETKAVIGDVIQTLHRELGTTVIHVTDDLAVAKRLAGRIVLMQDGVIRQVDTPEELFNNPCCKFAAGFLGEPPMNLFFAEVRKDGEAASLVFKGFHLTLSGDRSKKLLDGGYEGKRVILGVRPQDLCPIGEKEVSDRDGVIEAELLDIEMDGQDVYWHFETNDSEHTARAEGSGAGIGDQIFLAVNSSKIHIFDGESEKIIVN